MIITIMKIINTNTHPMDTHTIIMDHVTEIIYDPLQHKFYSISSLSLDQVQKMMHFSLLIMFVYHDYGHYKHPAKTPNDFLHYFYYYNES